MRPILLCVIILFNFTASQAQCDGRYQEEVFNEVSVTTVTYSDVYDLDVDIYQPIGDVETNRPLLILAHGGSFVGGVKTNPTIVKLGNTFAKRGYVVASITYRLMMISDFLDAYSALNGVAKAFSDSRAAIRYFRKSIAEGNPYNIDSNQIYFGGNSAGGALALHVAFMQEEEVGDSLLLVALNNNGGVNGNSGNEGYSSEVKGAISLAGGITDLNFITESDFDKLLISCHGDKDRTVQYLCGPPFSYPFLPLPELCGGGAILEHLEAKDFDKYHHLVFEGAGHVPWEFESASEDAMIRFVSENLYNNLDCANVIVSQKPYIFPNPTERMFTIESLKRVYNVIISNLKGGVILRSKDSSKINIEHLPQGIYVVEIHDENKKVTRTKVVKM